MIEEDFKAPTNNNLGLIYAMKSDYFDSATQTGLHGQPGRQQQQHLVQYNNEMHSDIDGRNSNDLIAQSVQSQSLQSSNASQGGNGRKFDVFKKLLTCSPLSYTERNVALTSMAVSGGGCIFGFAVGAMAGTLQNISDHFDMSRTAQGLIVAALYVGSMAGALFGGTISDAYGRWWACQAQTILFGVGSAVLGTARYVQIAFAGRFLLGFAGGFAVVSALPYLREISPARYSGRVTSTYEFMFVVGILAANIVSTVVYTNNNSWRHIFLLPIIFCAVQSVALWKFVPESPSWLLQQGRSEEAKAALQHIYNDHESVTDQISVINRDKITKSSGLFNTVVDTVTMYRDLLYILCILSIFYGICGGSIFLAYLPLILQSYAGFDTLTSLQYNAVVGAVRVLATMFAISRVDHAGSVGAGRRSVLLLGIAAIIVGQLWMGLTFMFSASSTDATAPQQWSNANVLFLLASCLAVLGQSVGFSMVSSLLQTEMFPTVIRSRAMSVALLSQNCGLFVVNDTFLISANHFPIQYLFFGYAVVGILAWGFVWLFVPETRGKRPIDILRQAQNTFRSYKSLCPCLSTENPAGGVGGGSKLSGAEASTAVGSARIGGGGGTSGTSATVRNPMNGDNVGGNGGGNGGGTGGDEPRMVSVDLQGNNLSTDQIDHFSGHRDINAGNSCVGGGHMDQSAMHRYFFGTSPQPVVTIYPGAVAPTLVEPRPSQGSS